MARKKSAIDVAELFATAAAEQDRGRHKGDWWATYLTEKQANWLIALLRAEGKCHKEKPGFGLIEVEQFDEVMRGNFSAHLGRAKRGGPPRLLRYRWTKSSGRHTGAPPKPKKFIGRRPKPE